MLCVRKITFIDRAGPASQWTHNLKKQWSFGDLIAVRVHDSNERVLGSTIPVPFIAAQEGQMEWGVSWIDEDPVENPEQPAENVEADASAALHGVDGAVSTAAPAAVAAATIISSPEQPRTKDTEHASATSQDVDQLQAQDPSLPPAVQENAAPPTPPAANNTTAVPAAAAAADLVDPAGEGKPPSAPTPETVAEEANESGDEAGVQAVDGSIGFSGTTDPDVAVPPAATAPPPPRAHEAAASSGSNSTTLAASAASPGSSATATVERRPSFSKCLSINIAQAAKGLLQLDIITASGEKLAVTEANVQAALDADVAGAPQVQHYAVVLSPLKERPGSTIYAVLEFSVVVGSTDSDAAVTLAASARYSSLPTSLDIGGTCAFSTCTFYFPEKFLTGTGEYIVTNVLCVESRSDNVVQLEVALPEDLKRVGVLPDKKVVISRRGERVFLTFTWNVFDAYVDLGADKNGDAESGSAGLHVLIRDGTENKAPLDIALVGDIPHPTAKGTGPFLFFVNHAKVSNVASNLSDDAMLADILPISLITRAGV